MLLVIVRKKAASDRAAAADTHFKPHRQFPVDYNVHMPTVGGNNSLQSQQSILQPQERLRELSSKRPAKIGRSLVVRELMLRRTCSYMDFLDMAHRWRNV